MKQVRFMGGLRVLAGGLLWLLALGALAAQTKIGELYYSLTSTDKTATVTSGSTEYAGDIVIPESVTYSGTTYSVTTIGEEAFVYCPGLTSVTIPNSVTKIWYGAFAYCTGLTSIEIPASVTEIGSWAFAYCTGLTSIELPASVTEIGEGAFYDCMGLTSVAIPNSVTTIGEGAFYNCTGLTSVTIPNSVTEISSSAFFGCTGLVTINVDESNTKYSSVDGVLYDKAKTSLLQCPGGKTGVVDIPSTVTSIGKGAFSGCTGLTSVTIPNSVTTIGSGAFRGCTGLTSVTIPNSVTEISSSAFSGCTGLTSVTIPNSVTTIGEEAFEGCTGLTSVTIPNSVTTIGSGAFEGCTGLTSVTIPNSVTEISSSAFSGCTGLTSINVDESNGAYCSVDGVLYNKAQTSLLLCPGGKTGVVNIPSSVTEIGEWAFPNCGGLTAINVDESNTMYSSVDGVLYNKDKTRLCVWPGGKTEVNISSSVTVIGAGAFAGCTGLTSVTIPNSVMSIGEMAFYGCTGLTSVTIADRETLLRCGDNDYSGVFASCPIRTLYLGGNIDYTFRGLTTLESLTIGGSVTTIGEGAFSGCTGLTAINVDESNTRYSSVDGVLYNKDKTVLCQCPGGKTGVVNILSSVTEISSSAFSGCTGLTSVTIPNSVTTIGSGAFEGCTGLTSVTIADRKTILRFNGEIFDLCPIRTLYLGGDIAYQYDDSPFCGLTTLETLTIGGSVTTIGGSAFSGCTGLTSIEILGTVTKIGSSAFSGCTGLTSVTIADRGTVLTFDNNYEGVFASCPIRTLYLGGDIDYYGYGSPFKNLTTLETLTIGGSVTRIGSFAFSGCTGLTSVMIPNSVTSIGDGAFSGCTGLTSVMIPNSVTSIGDGAFSGCTGLTAIKVDESNTRYRSVDGVLYNKDKTVLCQWPGGKTGVVNIPSSVTTIGNGAFFGCTGLTEVTIPASVDTVGYSAFFSCTGLMEFTIVDRETTLYFVWDSPFGLCPIRTLYLGGNIEMRESSSSPFCGMTTLETLTISTSVTEIGYSAFYGCTGLTSIEIPNSVTSIGGSAFQNCTGLTSVAMPAVTSIGSYAFAYCTGLTTFETGDAVKEIGDCAFLNCGGLLSLTFGKSVSKIGEGIVAGCDKLRRLICTSEEPAACHTNAFQDIHKIRCDLMVPETALEAYKNALVWGDFLRIAGGDGSDKVYVEQLSLTSPVTPAELKVGEGMLLSAVIAPANATNQALTWSSSDKNVLRVDYDGYVIAVGAGEAVVTARTTDGSNLSATCTVTVTAAGSGGDGGDGPGGGDDGDKILVETLSVSTGGASTELKAGGTLQLRAVVTPANATNKAVAWSSSDKKVATVDNDGYVVALAAGTVVITARTTDGSDLSATCTVTVTAAGSGGDGPGGGDEDEILVETISISTGGAITEQGVSARLHPGGTLQLRAIITPSNATNQAVTWSSSDKKVATVDNDGYVVALAAGTVVITARTTDGSNLSATCNLKVVGGNTAVEVPDALKAVRVYAEAGRIEVRGLPLGTAVTLSGVDGRLWYQTEAVTGPELTLSAPRGHVYVLRLNHTHSLKVYLP